MGEEAIWKIWRRLENSRAADFIQIGMEDFSLGVFEKFFWRKHRFSRVLCTKFWHRMFYCIELYTAILYVYWV
jgi:hypothetical protein